MQKSDCRCICALYQMIGEIDPKSQSYQTSLMIFPTSASTCRSAFGFNPNFGDAQIDIPNVAHFTSAKNTPKIALMVTSFGGQCNDMRWALFLLNSIPVKRHLLNFKANDIEGWLSLMTIIIESSFVFRPWFKINWIRIQNPRKISEKKLLVKKFLFPPRVKFTNVPRSAFMYVSCMHSFFVLMF